VSLGWLGVVGWWVGGAYWLLLEVSNE